MNVIIPRLLGFRFRKRRRYRAKKGLYAVLENYSGKNPVGDISMGGLSFYYTDNGTPWSRKKGGYLVLRDEGNIGSLRVSCRTVSLK